MQPPVEPIREHLTLAQVETLIEGGPAVEYGFGLEVTTLAQTEVEDISADLRGGTVERSSYATLHGSCRLALSRWLDWGSAVVRPYSTITDGVLSARFNHGAYFTSTPAKTFAEDPPTYDVIGYDLLHGLNTPVGDAFSVSAGESYLLRVEEILQTRGYTRYLIDQAAAATVLPGARVWAPDPQIKWLTIVNDLLASIGYQGIWSDWDGQLRCVPYEPPKARRPEWVFDTGPTSILGLDRQLEFDYFEAPNRWVIYRSNSVEGATPVVGNGIYTYVNQSVGPTSVDARGGLEITRHEGVDVAGQGELETRALQMIEADMSVPTTIPTSTAPFPLAWHFDRYFLDDPALGPPMDILGTQWSLPLGGTSMQQAWTVLG